MRIIKKNWRRPIVGSVRPFPDPTMIDDPEDDWIVRPYHYTTLSTGHHLYLTFGFYKGVANRFYYAWNPVTHLIDSKLEGHNHYISNGSVIMTPHVDNRIGTTAKAHLIYHHLILGRRCEKHILVTDGKQTDGGKRIWQRLVYMRGVSIHAFDTYEYLNLHPVEDEEEIWTYLKHGDKQIADVDLVAYS